MTINLFVSGLVLMAGTIGWAQSKSTESSKGSDVVQQITGHEKKARKKKVEMCSECGKPESECECHGHKKDEPKAAEGKKSSDGK